MENTNSLPTGCYKCGRPGHWSRDCPLSAPESSLPNTSSFKDSNSGGGAAFPAAARSKPVQETSKKSPKKRPKLTPDLLLSDDGLGYVLRHFPRAFRYRGRGREVDDLGNLIRLYSDWHSHLIPYYSFDQFVHKTEQVAASKRVKLCIKSLRERVASGGDLAKLQEFTGEDDGPNDEQVAKHSPGLDEGHHEDLFSDNHNADPIQEDMLNEIYQKATEELPAGSSGKEPSNQVPNITTRSLTGIHATGQEASMEVNRLKAQDSAAAGSSSGAQITEEQRGRMEANRLKALERAAARARALHAA